MRNILLYFSDQQRADTVGCYGQKLPVTPCLDRLAAEGVRFEWAFSPQRPLCGLAAFTFTTSGAKNTVPNTRANARNIEITLFTSFYLSFILLKIFLCAFFARARFRISHCEEVVNRRTLFSCNYIYIYIMYKNIVAFDEACNAGQ